MDEQFIDGNLVLKPFKDSDLLDWKYVLLNSNGSYEYLPTWMELCAVYVSELENIKNLDLKRYIITQGKKTIGVWTFSILEYKDGNKTIISNEAELIEPLFLESCPKKTYRKGIEACIKMLSQLCREVGITEFQTYGMSFVDGIGLWQTLLLENKCFDSIVKGVKYKYFMDLREKNEKQIFSLIRRRYKALINKGLREYNIKVYDSISKDEMDTFRKFHEMIKQRKTRSIATWSKQIEAINKGEAFLVILRENHTDIVGGGIFYLSNKISYYNSAAYDKSEGRKNVGHTTQYVAMQYAKTRGVKWHILGDCCFENDFFEPSKKELSISNYKEGFASHTFCKILINCQVK